MSLTTIAIWTTTTATNVASATKTISPDHGTTITTHYQNYY